MLFTNVVAYWILTESLVAEIQKKVEEAFGVFDHDRGNSVDVRYSGLLVVFVTGDSMCYFSSNPIMESVKQILQAVSKQYQSAE